MRFKRIQSIINLGMFSRKIINTERIFLFPRFLIYHYYKRIAVRCTLYRKTVFIILSNKFTMPSKRIIFNENYFQIKQLSILMVFFIALLSKRSGKCYFESENILSVFEKRKIPIQKSKKFCWVKVCRLIRFQLSRSTNS